ncbi:helix-turn-helix domain-containing protein [Streptomyces sp. NPDC053474]|uniref:helix-turn-helix domain-containing protein n=1 Tax=Streptomyces sp. NPDC053474 TaxID=3365704 RepID=UPI0037D6F054
MSGVRLEEPQRIAERLNFLFARVYSRETGPKTSEEVSLATGVPAEDIARLRRGLPLDAVASDEELFRMRLEHLMINRLGTRSISDVAKACGKTRQWLSNLRMGISGPRLDSTVRLARFFDVDTNFFTDDHLEALARHFGIECGVEFFTAADDSPAVIEAQQQVELAVVLREAGGIPAVLGRILGSFPESRG